MKIESRGKYPGVKVHLDPDEAMILINLAKDADKANGTEDTSHPAWPISGLGKSAKNFVGLSIKLGGKIRDLLADVPNLFEERTEDQILATLSKEAIESKMKLDAIGAKADWKKIKVEVKK